MPTIPRMTTLHETTYQDIINHKKCTNDELKKDLDKLKAFTADTNDYKFCGNKFLYHFQIENLLMVRRPRKKLLIECMNDPTEKDKLIKETEKRKRTGTCANRIYETFRINRGSVVFFKSSFAKYLYKHYRATAVLDPCAGWGGRMLGAWALDINYTGIDTNTDLVAPYNVMMSVMESPKLNMIWDSCFNVDFESIDYDFVLTSPPYINLEIYNNMTPFRDNNQFYTEFLIPLIDKCLKHIKRGGKVAFSISPKMYKELIECGYRECDESIDHTQCAYAKKKGDKVYVWNS